MRTYLLRYLATFVILLSVAGAAVGAHDGHDHKLLGTIASIDGNRVVVRPNEGPEKSVEITATTKFLRGKKRGMLQELRAGMRVVVNIGNGKAPLRAKEVQYPDTPTTSSRN